MFRGEGKNQKFQDRSVPADIARFLALADLEVTKTHRGPFIDSKTVAVELKRGNIIRNGKFAPARTTDLQNTALGFLQKNQKDKVDSLIIGITGDYSDELHHHIDGQDYLAHYRYFCNDLLQK